MSKRKSTRKEKQQAAAAEKYAAKPAPAAVKSRTKTTSSTANLPSRDLTFGMEFYKWIGGGFALVLLGMLLMAGGEMPSPDVWDEDIIYSFRRITLAPIVIMAGIGVVIYAIIKK